MAGSLYAGESDGGRIIRFGGAAFTQITTSGTATALSRLETHDFQPLGPSGDAVFRSVVVPIRVTNGYAIRVTPSVDGTALAAQDFSGSGSGSVDCQAWVKARGTRLSVVVEETARTGSLEWEDVRVAYVPIRSFP